MVVPGDAPAAPLPIRLPANNLGKAAADGPHTWGTAPMWETGMKLWLLALAWALWPFGQ